MKRKSLFLTALVLANFYAVVSAATAYQPRAMMPKAEQRLAPFNVQGEKNVQAAMPAMKKLFGDGPTDANLEKFVDMILLFERDGGFQGEAEVEAARRLLGLSQEFVDLCHKTRELIMNDNYISPIPYVTV